MALLEEEMVRFAESLDDYEHSSVTDMGGWGPIGFWLVVHDHRFDLSYEITSHCDYWDFIGALVDPRRCVSRAAPGGGVMQVATYSHDYDGERFQLPIDREDAHRRELIGLGLRVSFALAQENESSSETRPFILLDRFAKAVR